MLFEWFSLPQTPDIKYKQLILKKQSDNYDKSLLQAKIAHHHELVTNDPWFKMTELKLDSLGVRGESDLDWVTDHVITLGTSKKGFKEEERRIAWEW